MSGESQIYFNYSFNYAIIIITYLINNKNLTLKFMTEEKSTSSSTNLDVEANKTIAALSYLWILFLIPLLTKKNSKFCQFHAKQGLILFIIEIVGGLIFWFPVFGQILMLALLVVSVIGIIKALNGEWWKIPYIYELSKKINL